MCRKHRSRVNEDGSVRRRHRCEIGDTQLTSEGYVREKTANGWVAQHRLVMELHLGRALEDNETIHHLNGDKADNRPENLELWSRSHPRGSRALDLLAWAEQIIGRYGPLRDKLATPS